MCDPKISLSGENDISFILGKYANGIITDTYEVGQEVEVRIQITANHLGYFQFKLCANNDVSADKDQSCFDK